MPKLIKTKTNLKYLIEYLGHVIRPLVLIIPKMSGYVKTFKVKEGDALLVYDDRYIKTEIITYANQVYTNFSSLNVPENDIECESFTVISIDSLLAYENKYYLQVYLDNCAYKSVHKQMTDYLDENLMINICLRD